MSVARRHGWRQWGWSVVALLALLLAGCGQTSTDVARTLPGGVFTSQPYHFAVTYPAGWVANSNGCGAASGTCNVSTLLAAARPARSVDAISAGGGVTGS